MFAQSTAGRSRPVAAARPSAVTGTTEAPGRAVARATLRGLRLAVLLAQAVVALAAGAVYLPPLAGYETVIVAGGSMGRAVPVGSVAVLERRPAAEVETGDVILIEGSAHGVLEGTLHRAIEITGEPGSARAARTQGDANASADASLYELPPQTATLALAVPLAGYVAVLASAPAALVALGLASVLAVALGGNRPEGGRTTAARGVPGAAS